MQDSNTSAAALARWRNAFQLGASRAGLRSEGRVAPTQSRAAQAPGRLKASRSAPSGSGRPRRSARPEMEDRRVSSTRTATSGSIPSSARPRAAWLETRRQPRSRRRRGVGPPGGGSFPHPTPSPALRRPASTPPPPLLSPPAVRERRLGAGAGGLQQHRRRGAGDARPSTARPTRTSASTSAARRRP